MNDGTFDSVVINSKMGKPKDTLFDNGYVTLFGEVSLIDTSNWLAKIIRAEFEIDEVKVCYNYS